MRVARDIGMPLTQIMVLPARELRMWAAVYAAESGSDSAPDEMTGAEAFRKLGGIIAQGGRRP